MKNVYDNEAFFNEYAKMARSKNGLESAGEWYKLQTLFPQLKQAKVLDLGCGYGWHSKYAAQLGASEVQAIDLSEKMIATAKATNNDPCIQYKVMGLDEYIYPANYFDFVLSNLVLHYIDDIESVFQKIYTTLKTNGTFVFNIEHPIFTAGVNQDWIYDSDNKPLVWPVDNYFYPGCRTTHFLGQTVTKQHHTLTQILNGLLHTGFQIMEIVEAKPQSDWLEIPGMKDEMKRPMMLMVKAVKC